MQTFLTFPDYRKSAICLDWQRLGKQRGETKQIVQALRYNYGAAVGHPICKMWKNNISQLIHYGIAICDEWIDRGYKDDTKEWFLTELEMYGDDKKPVRWLGFEPLHASHRSNLLRKDSFFYSQFGWSEPKNLPYVWIDDDAFTEEHAAIWAKQLTDLRKIMTPRT